MLAVRLVPSVKLVRGEARSPEGLRSARTGAVTPTTELETELRAFFEGYARAFHADLDRFCDYFHFPSATVRLDGLLPVPAVEHPPVP